MTVERKFSKIDVTINLMQIINLRQRSRIFTNLHSRISNEEGNRYEISRLEAEKMFVLLRLSYRLILSWKYL